MAGPDGPADPPQVERSRGPLGGHRRQGRRTDAEAQTEDEDDLQDEVAGRGHHADGQVSCFQHRPLLDMQLEIGQQLAPRPRSRADMVGIEAELHERLAHRHAIAVAGVQNALVECAGHSTAAEQRRGEAHPLFIGKADDLDRERQALAAAIEICDAGDRRDHAKRPIPFAGIAYGVVVRAKHQAGRTRPLAFVATTDIADRVEMRTHAGLAHPAQDEVRGLAQLLGEIDARELAGLFRNRGQIVDPTHDRFAERWVLNGVNGPHSDRLPLLWTATAAVLATIDISPTRAESRTGAGFNTRVTSMNASTRQAAPRRSCAQAG